MTRRLVNCHDLVAYVRSSMEHPDASTSRVEEMCRFDSSVGSSSGGGDQSEGPPIVINRDRYNSSDGPSRLKLI